MSLPQPITQRHWTEDEGRELFNLLHSAFQRAIQGVGGAVEYFYEIGGFTFRLCFAGDALIPCITPAIKHLAAESTSFPDLTICLWDRVSTGIRMSLLSNFFRYVSWFWQEYVEARGELKNFHSERICAAFNPGSHILSMLDCERNLALYWIDSADQVPWYETGAPIRTILHWWLSRHQYQVIHAGAVGATTGGALLVGKGGTGKSTTALACLQSELTYAGDDYCLVTTKPSPSVYCLYNTAKLKREEDLARLPHLTNRLYNQSRAKDEKLMLFLYDHYPDKVVNGFPLKAILAPQVTGRLETTVKPITAGSALVKLAPSTIVQLPGAGQAALQTMAQLIRQLPCYLLNVGTDVTQIPNVILDIMETINLAQNP